MSNTEKEGRKFDIIKNNFKEAFERVTVFDNSMKEDQKKLRNIALQIKGKADAGSTLDPESFKEELAVFIEIADNLTLKDQDLKRHVIVMLEYYTLCRILGIDSDITEEEQKLIDAILAQMQTLFAVVKGEIVVADENLHGILTSELSKKVNDPEYLKYVLSTITSTGNQ